MAVAKKQNGEPENLGEPINAKFSDITLYIAPDESYLILYRFHSTIGFGLGFDADLSPDGKYLFLLDRGEGVYWVDANVVEGFR